MYPIRRLRASQNWIGILIWFFLEKTKLGLIGGIEHVQIEHVTIVQTALIGILNRD